MIKVNLLGDNNLESTSALAVLFYTAGVLVISLVVFGYLYISNSKKISGLVLEQRGLQSELTGLQERTKTVKDLDQKSKILKSKLSLIAKLKKSKKGPVRVMDDLNMAVPAKVWLREVKESNGSMKVKGRALNNQHIATMMQNLQSSEYFDQIDLVESRQMYYSRSTGKVTPMTDITRLKTTDFGRESRATKQSAANLGDSKDSKVVIKDDSKSGSARNRVSEANVTVNEFVLSAKVFYAGKSISQQTTTAETKK